MLDIFGGLKVILKRRDIEVDNAVFKLHYLFTSIMLVAFSLIITARQYVGQPIDCIQHDGIHYINVYCWIHATFAMPEHFHKKVGTEVAYHGVGPSGGRDGEKIYYSYYQWVCFILFFQAMLFHVPRFLWKVWEGGLMKTLTMGMHIALLTDEEKHAKKKVIIEYLQKHVRTHNCYAYRFFICEALCLVNVIGQMYLLDSFFGGEFMKYGLKVIEFSESNQDERTDPMIYVFPRMTKCTFYKYGTSGDIQKHDAICVLPLNIVNEKIFIFLWFWFIILSVITSMVIVYRIIILALPRLRPRLLSARSRMASREYLEAVLRKTKIGDWFVFYLLGKNIDPVIFRDIIAELAKKIETNDSNNP